MSDQPPKGTVQRPPVPMRKGYARKREKAFRLRVERKTLSAISREIGVCTKTLSRWENGWVDAKGRENPGWKAELEKAWQELAEAELRYGLILKEERIKAYEELARMAINKIKEAFPNITARTAADAKALMSEIRELGRLIAMETGALKSGGPTTVIGIKQDISLGDLRERYRQAHEEGQAPDALP